VYIEIKEYKEENNNTKIFIVVHPMWVSPFLTIL